MHYGHCDGQHSLLELLEADGHLVDEEASQDGDDGNVKGSPKIRRKFEIRCKLHGCPRVKEVTEM